LESIQSTGLPSHIPEKVIQYINNNTKYRIINYIINETFNRSQSGRKLNF
jgi:hypothetical protein